MRPPERGRDQGGDGRMGENHSQAAMRPPSSAGVTNVDRHPRELFPRDESDLEDGQRASVVYSRQRISDLHPPRRTADTYRPQENHYHRPRRPSDTARSPPAVRQSSKRPRRESSSPARPWSNGPTLESSRVRHKPSPKRRRMSGPWHSSPVLESPLSPRESGDEDMPRYHALHRNLSWTKPPSPPSKATTEVNGIKGVPTGPSGPAGPPPIYCLPPVSAAIKQVPHAFISSTSLPAATKTTPHLFKLLVRSTIPISLGDIYVDETGWFITFPNTPRGQRSLALCEKKIQGMTMFGMYHLRVETFDGAPESNKNERQSVQPDKDKDDTASSASGLSSGNGARSCHVCKGRSDPLIKCATCPRRYHRSCHTNKTIPQDDRLESWQCQRCTRKGVPPKQLSPAVPTGLPEQPTARVGLSNDKDPPLELESSPLGKTRPETLDQGEPFTRATDVEAVEADDLVEKSFNTTEPDTPANSAPRVRKQSIFLTRKKIFTAPQARNSEGQTSLATKRLEVAESPTSIDAASPVDSVVQAPARAISSRSLQKPLGTLCTQCRLKKVPHKNSGRSLCVKCSLAKDAAAELPALGSGNKVDNDQPASQDASTKSKDSNQLPSNLRQELVVDAVMGAVDIPANAHHAAQSHKQKIAEVVDLGDDEEEERQEAKVISDDAEHMRNGRSTHRSGRGRFGKKRDNPSTEILCKTTDTTIPKQQPAQQESIGRVKASPQKASDRGKEPPFDAAMEGLASSRYRFQELQARAQYGACDECKACKIRCSGEAICDNCVRDHKTCVYPSRSDHQPQSPIKLPVMKSASDHLLAAMSQSQDNESGHSDAGDSLGREQLQTGGGAENPAKRPIRKKIKKRTFLEDLAEASQPSIPIKRKMKTGITRQSHRVDAKDQFDLGNSDKRPKGTYWRLFALALCAAPTKRLQVVGATKWIAENVPGYTLGKGIWEGGIQSTMISNVRNKSGMIIARRVQWQEGDGGKEATVWYELLPNMEDRLEHWDYTLKRPIPPLKAMDADQIGQMESNTQSDADEVSDTGSASKNLRAGPDVDDDAMEVDATPEPVDYDDSDSEPLASRSRRKRQFGAPVAAMMGAAVPPALDDRMEIGAAGPSTRPSQPRALIERNADSDDFTLPIRPQVDPIVVTSERDEAYLLSLVNKLTKDGQSRKTSFREIWPEYQPGNGSAGKAKVRPSRKQRFGKPPMLAHQQEHARGSAASLLVEPMTTGANGEPLDGTTTLPCESLDDFFEIKEPQPLVPVLVGVEKQLGFRSANSRSRNVYKLAGI